MLGSGMLPAASGAVWLRHSTSVKIAASGWVLALSLLIAHAKRVLLALQRATCLGLKWHPSGLCRHEWHVPEGRSSACEEDSCLPLLPLPLPRKGGRLPLPS